ncbi:MAG: hypothetical protein NVS1B6_06730 [Steroidobacteraceae bacterium]
MRGTIILFCMVTGLSNGVYAGDVFRCVAANGDVMFTNMACPVNSQVQHVASYEPVSDTPAPTYDAAATAAAASALEARKAAQQAAAAAYQAQMVYREAQTEARSEQSSDGTEYAAEWISFYPQFGSHFHDHHHHPRQAMAAQSAVHSPHHAVPVPHAQNTVFALHH